MISLESFIADHNGETNLGDTDMNRGQCVGLIEAWLDNLGTPHIWGNASDLLHNADPADYVVTYNDPNDANQFPQPGDVICWQAGWEGSSVGHTAVVVRADGYSFTVFEQNDRLGGGNGACRTYRFANYSGVLGWIHPKVLDPAPVAPAAPEPAPAPAPVDPAPVETPAPVVPSEPPVVNNTPTPAPTKVIVPVKGDNVKVTPKTHHVLSITAVVLSVLYQLAGQISAMDTVTITGLIGVLLGAIERK